MAIIKLVLLHDDNNKDTSASVGMKYLKYSRFVGSMPQLVLFVHLANLISSQPDKDDRYNISNIQTIANNSLTLTATNCSILAKCVQLFEGNHDQRYSGRMKRCTRSLRDIPVPVNIPKRKFEINHFNTKVPPFTRRGKHKFPRNTQPPRAKHNVDEKLNQAQNPTDIQPGIPPILHTLYDYNVTRAENQQTKYITLTNLELATALNKSDSLPSVGFEATELANRRNFSLPLLTTALSTTDEVFVRLTTFPLKQEDTELASSASERNSYTSHDGFTQKLEPMAAANFTSFDHAKKTNSDVLSDRVLSRSDIRDIEPTTTADFISFHHGDKRTEKIEISERRTNEGNTIQSESIDNTMKLSSPILGNIFYLLNFQKESIRGEKLRITSLDATTTPFEISKTNSSSIQFEITNKTESESTTGDEAANTPFNFEDKPFHKTSQIYEITHMSQGQTYSFATESTHVSPFVSHPNPMPRFNELTSTYTPFDQKPLNDQGKCMESSCPRPPPKRSNSQSSKKKIRSRFPPMNPNSNWKFLYEDYDEQRFYNLHTRSRLSSPEMLPPDQKSQRNVVEAIETLMESVTTTSSTDSFPSEYIQVDAGVSAAKSLYFATTTKPELLINPAVPITSEYTKNEAPFARSFSSDEGDLQQDAEEHDLMKSSKFSAAVYDKDLRSLEDLLSHLNQSEYDEPANTEQESVPTNSDSRERSNNDDLHSLEDLLSHLNQSEYDEPTNSKQESAPRNSDARERSNSDELLTSLKDFIHHKIDGDASLLENQFKFVQPKILDDFKTVYDQYARKSRGRSLSSEKRKLARRESDVNYSKDDEQTIVDVLRELFRLKSSIPKAFINFEKNLFEEAEDV